MGKKIISEYEEGRKKKNVPIKKCGSADGIRYVMTSTQYGEKQGVKNPFDLNELLIQYGYLGAEQYQANMALHRHYRFEAAKDLTGSYKEILEALDTEISKLRVCMYPEGISLRFRTPAGTAFDVNPVLAPSVSRAMSVAASL